MQPSDIVLNHIPFWVRLYNLPLDSRFENHIRTIDSIIGEVVKVDTDGVLWINLLEQRSL